MSSKQSFSENGFLILDEIYSETEINQILNEINSADSQKDTFRKTSDLFAIRQILKEIPKLNEIIFNENLRNLIQEFIGNDFFVVKSIYFDKPETSNWYVAYHQDLTISVDKKIELENFNFWTKKQNQYAVQPPIEILENIVTIRIHLDETNEKNGAMKVVPKSHSKKIYRPETIDWSTEKEVSCNVNKGGVMLMKPLLLHASGRTINNQKRRVIHIELSNFNLPNEINWSEKMMIN